MGTHGASPARSANPSRARRQTTIDLLRLLIAQWVEEDERENSGKEKDFEEIILDAELDGERFLLVRIPRTQRTPALLSPREQEIVRLVAQGHPNKVIAAVLNISTWTVATHLRRIFAKVGVSSRAAMIARLLERGKIMRAHVADSPTFAKVSATPSSSNSNSRVARKYPARAQDLFGHVPVEKSS